MANAESKNSIFGEATQIGRLAFPLIANNVAITLTTFIDFVMAGRLGATQLAAVGVGNTVWAFCFLFGLGVLMAVSPTVAFHTGSGNRSVIGAYSRQGMWLSQALALIVMLAIYLAAAPLLEAIGIAPEIRPHAIGYLRAIALGLPAIYFFLALRYTSEGIGHTKPVMYIAVMSLIVNTVGNYALMFGKWGFPALGAVGCGLSSAISMWFGVACMLVYIRLRPTIYRPLGIFARFDWPARDKLGELLKLGLPIGGSVTAEVGLFSAVGLIMGILGANEAAAHAIAINYAATMFMVPLALHSAITIRVGQALGAGRRSDARFVGWVGIASCGAFMLLSALALIVLREPVTRLYIDDPAVREIAVGLLFMAMIFQVSDGLQIGAAGALRGFKDTAVPLWLNVIAFWLIGFPIAYLAGLRFGWGPQGVWFGLAAGLTAATVLLGGRFWIISRTGAAATPAQAIQEPD